MDAVAELRKQIGELEKHLSLRQIALQSGINYITLRNIKFGKSSRVTESVMQRFTKFYSTFNPEAAAEQAAPKKRGRKKGSTNKSKAPVQKEAKKRGRKPAAPVAPEAPAPVAPAPAPVVPAKGGDAVLDALNQEIAALQTRIDSLMKIRDDYKEMLG